MTFFKLKYIVLILIGVFLYSCSKKKEIASESHPPVVSFVSFTINSDESAYLKITVFDPNGDIGHATDTTRNFYANYYYKDTISQNYVAFWSPSINDSLKTGYTIFAGNKNNLYSAENLKAMGINKNTKLDITLRLIEYRHSIKVKHLKYVIYMFDEAGNKSNVVTTPEITAP